MSAIIPAQRFVPAVVAGADCPTWCTNDHATDLTSPEDLWHGSDYADLTAPVMGRGEDIVLFARLGMDPASKNPLRRQPFVVVADSSDAADMTPDAADAFADNLVAFAAQIRELARTAREVSRG
ncbi:hypothetical protein EAO71_27215 [Streptomyces sp. ms191]|uniref:DUF6907 domain-containing protein n=1 Tax=Streptomyces sp. ms191 TaxID=1827978 RepID=UPI0011CE2942|nr:hypothetical protein [Streptomyces sp. ms191]TXS21394.1 hypothetical protein EAO71_27215 [Streptomyces sp. ms191]